jgi:hypothetical protein
MIDMENPATYSDVHDSSSRASTRKYVKRNGMCSGCGVEPTKPSRRYCLKCHAAYMREWRKTHPVSKEQQVKIEARVMASMAQAVGILKEQPCEVCGAKAEKHHDDYLKPLEVRWLCREHHLEHHATAPVQKIEVSSRPATEKQLKKARMDTRKRRADYDRKLKAEFHKIPLCPTCKTNPRALSQSTCLPCKAEYMRERREQNARSQK